jgi:hypothetical protein
VAKSNLKASKHISAYIAEQQYLYSRASGQISWHASIFPLPKVGDGVSSRSNRCGGRRLPSASRHQRVIAGDDSSDVGQA